MRSNFLVHIYIYIRNTQSFMIKPMTTASTIYLYIYIPPAVYLSHDSFVHVNCRPVITATSLALAKPRLHRQGGWRQLHAATANTQTRSCRSGNVCGQQFERWLYIREADRRNPTGTNDLQRHLASGCETGGQNIVCWRSNMTMVFSRHGGRHSISSASWND